MTTYAWGAECPPPFTRDDLARLSAHLRAAMAGIAADESDDRGRRRRHGGGRGGPWGPPPRDFAPGPWAEAWIGGAPGGSRGSRGPRGGRRGRAGRGDVRLAILALLAEGPRHGYQLIQDITERSQGAWAPSPGAIYPALSALQDEGLVDDEKVDGRRVFSLTSAGRAEVDRRAEDLARVFSNNAAGPEHEELADLRDLVWGVGGAALAVLGSGSPEQRERAREILARTRRELYRILAEDAGDEAGDEADVEAGEGAGESGESAESGE